MNIMNYDELDFQQAYVRFLTDPEFRSVLLCGEPVDTDRWELSSETAERLQELDSERTGLFSELLLSNRLEKAQEAFPLTTKLLGDSLLAVIQDFNLSVPTKDPRKHAEARAFGGYLQKRLDSEPIGPAYLGDVLLYEFISLLLRFDFDGRCWKNEDDASGELLQHLSQPCSPKQGSRKGIYLHLTGHHRLLSFGYDIERICNELQQGSIKADIEPRMKMLFLYMMPDSSMQQLEVNNATAAFLLTAEGFPDFDDAIKQLSSTLHQQGEDALTSIYNGCLKLCGELIRLGVLRLSESAVSTKGLVN